MPDPTTPDAQPTTTPTPESVAPVAAQSVSNAEVSTQAALSTPPTNPAAGSPTNAAPGGVAAILKSKKTWLVLGGVILLLAVVYGILALMKGSSAPATIFSRTTPSPTADISVNVSPKASSSASPTPSSSPVSVTNLQYRNQEQRISYSYPSNFEVITQNLANAKLSTAVYDPGNASTTAKALIEINVYASASKLGLAKDLGGSFTTVDDVLAAGNTSGLLARWSRNLNAGQLSYSAETGVTPGTGDAYYLYVRDSSEVIEVIDRARSVYTSSIRNSLNIFAQ